MLALLLFHAVVAAAAALLGKRLGRASFALAATAPAAALAWVATRAGAVLDGAPVTETIVWVPGADLELGMRLDAFSLLMVLLVSGVGVLVFAYAAWYFDTPRPDVGRYAGLLCGFSGAMLGLVLSDHLISLFIFWELTSITSYLLIGLQHTRADARNSALQALLITGAGGLVLLAGLLLIGQAADTFSLAEIIANPPTGSPLMGAAALCVLVGVATKSAQVPFHSWLPGAMAAPTPVSAYLHSATMVKAGVYLAARLAPVFVVTTSVWRPTAMTLGAVTMLLGGYRALRQHDLKLVLAYGTVSQLGFLVVLMAAGNPYALHAGVVVLLAHGIFKATLFMVVGVIDHSCGTRDLRAVSGVGRRLPVLAVIGTAAAMSMAGVPLLFGFVAKEAALDALLHLDELGAAAPYWLAAVAAGSALTFAYSARFVRGAFTTKRPTAGIDLAEVHHAPAAPFVAPAAVLTVVTVILGVLPALASRLTDAATIALDGHAEPHGLALWHGLGAPVYLTAAIIAVGSFLIVAAGPLERLQGRLPAMPTALGGYQRSLDGILAVAGRVTAVVQNGSLPVYLGVILATAVVLPAAVMLQAPLAWRPERFADSPLQIVAAAVIVAGAIGAATATRRFSSVLALGVAGYGMVTVFALHGAPDLALTQLLVETLGVVVFVLALRHLPARFAAHRWPLTQTIRWIIAVSVGVFVTGFALAAGAARPTGTAGVSADFLANAEKAGGHNVVNVILVDFRGFDTLGEITVLAVAAAGFAALVLAGRDRRRSAAIDDHSRSTDGSDTAGPSTGATTDAHRISA